ncbi:phenylalanine--tRNA ligase subunit beta [Salinisphaera sp. LB1]|uniref:phenylalanine--tRNA ligase subunit beta n=1 Tax=Salinisphaera sp. LB1 TaxID=2183911 RepID=UPI000D7052AB|nr:phenylalanine--tRNA ligase subunit beta [Salinisphaera sp. LB1]AWN16942.1 Phenylalanyl-tRNA synthetase beta chain [Salinisphaera sp. LB1]
MRISEQWLREWVAVDASIEAIAEQLTMAGMEVDAIEPAAPDLSGVVVGEVVSCQAHPDADKLRVCEVDTGAARQQIVCGAPNVAAGVRVPVATVGARLPGGMKIKAAELRGVASNGMLCSVAELGLGSDTGGLWLLPSDAPVGCALADYLETNDTVVEIDLTPNRGDCLSMRGVAREVAVAFGAELMDTPADPPAEVSAGAADIVIEATDLCAAYAGRRIDGVDAVAAAPVWMRERLRRAGIRSINLPVDIGNYVMLDIGQPMHAFDADKLVGGICVRRARAGESITTLDGQDVELQADTLVIADDEGPVAIAGMIGGQRTAVDPNTCNILFEAACFTPAAVAGQGRRYKIHTDSLHRFERGVDPALHARALDRASALMVAFGGGRCGPAAIVEGRPVWPGDRTIELRGEQMTRLLGQPIPGDFIAAALVGLGARCEPVGDQAWRVMPPSWRYDLAIEADLVEEVARVYGYDRLTAEAAGVVLPPARVGNALLEATLPGEVLRQRGYHEAITYSFVDPELHAELTGDAAALALDNPISEQMIVMRRTLWAGLLGAWAHNSRRQQSRVRLYEQGLRFWPAAGAENGMAQVDTIAGLIAGAAHPPHWDETAREVDFFDVRGDVEALFARGGSAPVLQPETHPALHPGRSARIYVGGQPVGWIGQLAPGFARRYKGQALPYLFEIDRSALEATEVVRYTAPSDQPRVTRDLALVVPETVAVGDLIAAVDALDNDLIQSVQVFDVFRGHDLESGLKSVALSLIFQDKTSTLNDETVDRIITDVTDALRARCDARLRGE